MSVQTPSPPAWPELPYGAWSDTCTTLYLWTQIVGKVRLAKSPWVNHSRHVTLYVTARGLTTSPIPDGERQFQIDFDFIDLRGRSYLRRPRCDPPRLPAEHLRGRRGVGQMGSNKPGTGSSATAVKLGESITAA